MEASGAGRPCESATDRDAAAFFSSPIREANGGRWQRAHFSALTEGASGARPTARRCVVCTQDRLRVGQVRSQRLCKEPRSAFVLAHGLQHALDLSRAFVGNPVSCRKACRAGPLRRAASRAPPPSIRFANGGGKRRPALTLCRRATETAREKKEPPSQPSHNLGALFAKSPRSVPAHFAAFDATFASFDATNAFPE
jgi:hypothetical protein